MKLELNERELKRLYADLDLQAFNPMEQIKAVPMTPDIAVTLKAEFGTREVHGVYSPLTRSISIFLNISHHEANRLRFITSEINRTILHEVRHLWQDINWPKADWDDKNKIESDAIRFEKEHGHEYRVCRVIRPRVRNGFTKLAAAEGRIRRS